MACIRKEMLCGSRVCFCILRQLEGIEVELHDCEPLLVLAGVLSGRGLGEAT